MPTDHARKLFTNVRREIGGPWGWMYEVTDAFDDIPIARGWRATEELAREALEQCVKDACENGGYIRGDN